MVTFNRSWCYFNFALGAPIIDAISKIDALKSDVSGFMDEVGNFLFFEARIEEILM